MASRRERRVKRSARPERPGRGEASLLAPGLQPARSVRARIPCSGTDPCVVSVIGSSSASSPSCSSQAWGRVWCLRRRRRRPRPRRGSTGPPWARPAPRPARPRRTPPPSTRSWGRTSASAATSMPSVRWSTCFSAMRWARSRRRHPPSPWLHPRRRRPRCCARALWRRFPLRSASCRRRRRRPSSRFAASSRVRLPPGGRTRRARPSRVAALAEPSGSAGVVSASRCRAHAPPFRAGPRGRACSRFLARLRAPLPCKATDSESFRSQRFC